MNFMKFFGKQLLYEAASECYMVFPNFRNIISKFMRIFLFKFNPENGFKIFQRQNSRNFKKR